MGDIIKKDLLSYYIKNAEVISSAFFHYTL
ncbi:hypothetical protein X953_04980 [Virgibacillus sp. SK37]|nr:hypothetical protein X953_04980 [Virgibacillus sp. SK37]